jgi:hypothetical protein
MFWCPGCDGAHAVGVGTGTGPRWSWNGNAEKPTFTPSVLVRGAAEDTPDRTKGNGGFNPDAVCHSFVTDGKIQFLGDCTHALAGQTIDLPAW